MAQTLGGMDLSSGTEDEGLRAGSAIQHAVAEWHGRQRHGLGWHPEEVRREFEILREELAAAIRRRVRGEKGVEVERAVDAVGEFVAAAERVSLAVYGVEVLS